MKLSKIYEEIFIKDAWDKLEEAFNETVLIEESNVKLDALLQESEKVVFDNFGIDSSEKKYFIAGSARLYLYPGLIDFINNFVDETNGLDNSPLPKTPAEPGDLDIVIPDKNYWDNLKNNISDKVDMNNFESNFNKGIFRPNELGLTKMDIEVFDEWAPQRAGDIHVNTKIDSTRNILDRATKNNGYYYMNMYDIINYKFQMGRDKDFKIAQLINNYINRKEKRSKEDLFRILSRIIKMRYTPID